VKNHSNQKNGNTVRNVHYMLLNGTLKGGKKAHTPTAWIIDGDDVVGVRKLKDGDYIAVGDYPFQPKYPPDIKVYATEKEAWEAYHKIVNSCDHDYQMISHDEAKCRKCGNIICVPDM